MYWIAVSSKLIRFVLHFGHKYLYQTHIKRLINNFVCRSVISYLVSFLLFCKLHNSLLVIISILILYPFHHLHDSTFVIFHRIFKFEKSSVLRMLLLWSAWILTFNISGDANPPTEDLGTIGVLCCFCLPDMVAIVMFVLLLSENRVGHKIWGVTAPRRIANCTMEINIR